LPHPVAGIAKLTRLFLPLLEAGGKKNRVLSLPVYLVNSVNPMKPSPK
jgi:hypothetical protein